MNTSRDTFEKT